MTKAEELKAKLNDIKEASFTKEYDAIMKMFDVAIQNQFSYIEVDELSSNVQNYLINVDGFKVNTRWVGDRDNSRDLIIISIPDQKPPPTSHNKPEVDFTRQQDYPNLNR